MPALTLALVQADLIWHDPAANRRMFDALLARVPANVDVIALPEMFSTGFTMQPSQCHETMTGDTLSWMAAHAHAKQAVLCGSLAMAVAGAGDQDGRAGDNRRFVNRFVWMPPNGDASYYDKRHLFRMSGEHEHYDAGNSRPVFMVKGVRVLPQVCYDLRFPVFSRNRNDYDLLLYVANWPAARQNAWETLLRARAIENLCFVVCVNRVGVDGNGVHYDGGSGLFAPNGDTRLWARTVAGVHMATLDVDELQRYRESFPAWRDADEFWLG